jgi:phosphoribosylaminoimidazole carboxylase PurE protein
MADSPVVGILMGSKSDREVVERAAATLTELGISYEWRIASAHRTPEAVRTYASEAEGRGVRIIICAAGMAAHLAGVVAAHTDLPVIGVPMPGGAGGGLDSLLSTAQMPGGVPVATMSLGKAGAVNAAVLAARILALTDGDVKGKLEEYRRKMEAAVDAANEELG